jgi:hypothetical protein
MMLKFRRETKIVFIALVLIILGAAVFIAINYNKLKNPDPVSQTLGAYIQARPISTQPKGTCAPDTAACGGNAKLCMEENKNQICD